jgi:thiol-disulfide isomerase/thioredoxin
MGMKHIKIFFGLALLLFLAASSPGLLGQQGRPEQAPEYSEFRRALNINDPAARLKELERLQGTYPHSQFQRLFENAIIRTRVEISTDLASVLALQKKVLEALQGLDQLAALADVGQEILEHPRLDQFDQKAAASAVLDYAARGLKLAEDPEFLKSVTENEKRYIPFFVLSLGQAKAQAFLLAQDVDQALQALEEYKARGGPEDMAYAYLMGTIKELKGQDQEALDYYFQAAVANYKDSRDKALHYYKKTTGSSEGFEARLESKQRELPFHPQPFQAGPDWKGKAVVVELFTGSECPPCVAADLAVDGLLETFSPKYLAVLEYHLPIPRPDPLMNHATALRASHYGVRSAPSVFFDGQPLTGGGGPFYMAEAKYDQYLKQIRQRINAHPGLKLGLTATRLGDDVQIAYTLDKALDNVGYHIALVQKEEKFSGGNGILFHKMVVREFKTLEGVPGLTGRLTINIPASERAAQEWIAAYERQMSFKSKEKHTAIDRTKLQVVFFAQDRSTGKVHTAVVADVK